MSGGLKCRGEYRNGYYERDFVTRFGTLRLRVARTRGRLSAGGMKSFQRRAEEVLVLLSAPRLAGTANDQCE